MKPVLFLSLFFLSCNSADNADNQDNPSIGKKFFIYDSVDHYFNDYSENSLELIDNASRSSFDSLKAGVIINGIPNGISDLYFIAKLESIGYTRTAVARSKFLTIDKIFIEKPVNEIIGMDCVPIFRDILIFKRNNKVVGIAKICFECYESKIYGTDINTIYFGQNGDYEKVEKILRN